MPGDALADATTPRRSGLERTGSPSVTTVRLLPRVELELCGAAAAPTVHRITQETYAPYAALDPPSDAGLETEATVRQELGEAGGALLRHRGQIVGCLRFSGEGLAAPGVLEVERLAILPAFQHRGLGQAAMRAVERYARTAGYREIALGVRLDLPRNLRFYMLLGYAPGTVHRTADGIRDLWMEMRKLLATA